ncbi:MAG: hypothetical protein R3Y64_11410 [Peptostreptococcaceae bacterium]
MRFNIVLEDGGVYLDSLVLSHNGLASSVYEIKQGLKFKGFIVLSNSKFKNEIILKNDIYRIEMCSGKESIIQHKIG